MGAPGGGGGQQSAWCSGARRGGAGDRRSGRGGNRWDKLSGPRLHWQRWPCSLLGAPSPARVPMARARARPVL